MMSVRTGLIFLCCYLLFTSMKVVKGADVVEVANFDFESGSLTGWNAINSGAGVSVSTEDKNNGSYAVKLIASSASDYWSVQLEMPQINTLAGHLYRISFWAKTVGGGGIIRLSTAASNQLIAENTGQDRQYLPDLNIGNEWTKYTYESVYGSGLKAVGSVLKIRFDAGKVPGKVYYIDDVLIEDLTPELEIIDNGTTPMAKNHAKFLGNIIADQVPDNFNIYWNQVTSENAGKWESVERQRNVMTWTAHDRAYNHAKTNGFKFKYHTLVWGSQEPTWLGSLTQAQQKIELEEFMQAVANRYPDIDYIDVVNEALHAPSSIRQALGGDGVTGWDWVVWSFRKARTYFPNAKLHINDYGIISDPPQANRYVEIINILKQENLIDGIGIQCHEFNMNTVQVSTMRNVLGILAATGLPIHVSELDITGNTSISEENQFQVYRDKFPILWEHESVIGITLWGYISGTTWKTGPGIVEQDGHERKAMVWLKNYMASERSRVPNKFENYSNNMELRFDDDMKIYPNPVDDFLTIKGKNIRGIKILDISGKIIRSAYENETLNVQDLNKGVYLLQIEYDSHVVMKKFMKR